MPFTEHIWRNFVASVWVLIGFCAWDAVSNMLMSAEIRDAYGTFSSRVLLAPVVIGVMELLLWFRPFKDRENGARLMAGFMGILLLLKLVVTSLLVADLYGYETNRLELFLFLYVALSHLGFAIWGKDARY